MSGFCSELDIVLGTGTPPPALTHRTGGSSVLQSSFIQWVGQDDSMLQGKVNAATNPPHSQDHGLL